MGFSVPNEMTPKYQPKTSRAEHYSLSHCCLFASAAIVGVVATGVALYTAFNKTPGI